MPLWPNPVAKLCLISGLETARLWPRRLKEGVRTDGGHAPAACPAVGTAAAALVVVAGSPPLATVSALAWFTSLAVAGGARRCRTPTPRDGSAAVADGELDGGEGAAACLRQRPPRWQAIATPPPPARPSRPHGRRRRWARYGCNCRSRRRLQSDILRYVRAGPPPCRPRTPYAPGGRIRAEALQVAEEATRSGSDGRPLALGTLTLKSPTSPTRHPGSKPTSRCREEPISPRVRAGVSAAPSARGARGVILVCGPPWRVDSACRCSPASSACHTSRCQPCSKASSPPLAKEAANPRTSVRGLAFLPLSPMVFHPLLPLSLRGIGHDASLTDAGSPRYATPSSKARRCRRRLYAFCCAPSRQGGLLLLEVRTRPPHTHLHAHPHPHAGVSSRDLRSPPTPRRCLLIRRCCRRCCFASRLCWCS